MTWLLSLITKNPLTIAAACFIFGAAVGAVPVWKYQGAKLDAVKDEYKSFVDQTRVIGEQAQKQAKLDKEKYDAQHKKDMAANADIARRLQDARASSGYAPLPDSSGRACFNRAELDLAIRRFDEEVSGLVEKGAGAVNDLDIAKQWAQGRR